MLSPSAFLFPQQLKQRQRRRDQAATEAKIKGCIEGSCEKESFYKWVEDILSSINGVDGLKMPKRCLCLMKNAGVL